MSKQFGPKDYDAEKGKVYSLIINCIQRLRSQSLHLVPNNVLAQFYPLKPM